jgi:hypothetical protein
VAEPEFKVHDAVEKTVGDYYFAGRVVVVFRKLGRDLTPDPDGPWRYVVQNPDGVLMIYNADQLKAQTP